MIVVSNITVNNGHKQSQAFFIFLCIAKPLLSNKKVGKLNLSSYSFLI